MIDFHEEIQNMHILRESLIMIQFAKICSTGFLRAVYKVDKMPQFI